LDFSNGSYQCFAWRLQWYGVHNRCWKQVTCMIPSPAAYKISPLPPVPSHPVALLQAMCPQASCIVSDQLRQLPAAATAAAEHTLWFRAHQHSSQPLHLQPLWHMCHHGQAYMLLPPPPHHPSGLQHIPPPPPVCDCYCRAAVWLHHGHLVTPCGSSTAPPDDRKQVTPPRNVFKGSSGHFTPSKCTLSISLKQQVLSWLLSM
jgi:hypothetical protein